MKKRVLVLMLSVLLVLSLAACGGGGDTPIQDHIEYHFDTDPDMQAEMDAMVSMLGLGEGASLDFIANDADNELIFVFTFGEFEQEGLNDDLLGVSGQALSMLPLEAMAADLRDEIGIDSLVLTISFYSPDGNEIMSSSAEA